MACYKLSRHFLWFILTPYQSLLQATHPNHLLCKRHTFHIVHLQGGLFSRKGNFVIQIRIYRNLLRLLVHLQEFHWLHGSKAGAATSSVFPDCWTHLPVAIKVENCWSTRSLLSRDSFESVTNSLNIVRKEPFRKVSCVDISER